MVNLINTAAGGTNGAAATTANTGGASGNAFDYMDVTGTFEYTTTQAHGVLGYHLVGNATKVLFGWTSTSITTPSKMQTYRAYIRMPSYPTAELQIITPRNPTAFCGGVNLTAAGKLKATQLGGAALYTTTSTLALNTWYRIEVSYEVGTATVTPFNGVIRFAVFLGDSTTPLETTFTTSSANLGVDNIVSWHMGKLSSSNNWEAYWDSIELDTTTSSLMGPFIASVTSIRPASVISNPGGWLNIGGAASLEGAVADESNTTYIETPPGPSGAAITFGPNGTLASGTPSYLITLGASSGSPAASAVVDLLQGTTVIATRTYTALPTTPTAYSFTLTGPETAAITSRSDLRWRVTATAV